VNGSEYKNLKLIKSVRFVVDILYLFYVVYCLILGFPTRRIPQAKISGGIWTTDWQT